MQIDHVYVGDSVERLYKTRWRRDGGGNIVSMVEAMETPEQRETRYNYNAAGQKTQHIKPDGNTLTYAYDAKGRLAHFASDNNSFHYVYSYDILDNPTDVYDEITQTHTYCAFDSNGRLTSETLANGLTVDYAYDQKRPRHPHHHARRDSSRVRLPGDTTA
jgi:YD repeat-containing protein